MYTMYVMHLYTGTLWTIRCHPSTQVEGSFLPDLNSMFREFFDPLIYAVFLERGVVRFKEDILQTSQGTIAT